MNEIKDVKKVKAAKARAKSLPPEVRTKIATKGANARWHDGTAVATHEGPLEMGGAEIQCYVLDDETRVMSTRGVMKALGRSWRGRKHSGTQLPVFLEAKNLKPFITNELALVLEPVIFRTKKGGPKAEGVKAEALQAVCEIYLKAERAKVLTAQQLPIAKQCETLIFAFSKTGLTALVDEATGYQEVRDRKALQAILDKFLTDEWAKWSKIFPDEFYKELFRLKGLDYPGKDGRKPQYVGHWTNDVIYSRLAPGVKDELKQKNPRTAAGNRKRKHHQHLTHDYGHPELKELLSNATFLMKASKDWNTFKRMLDAARPKYGSTLEIDF